MNKFLFTAILVFVISVFSAMDTNAQVQNEKQSIILIIDASGSMWGQIDGKAKIGIAKEALTSIINELPDDIEVGLVAYGHRKKGDCKDVEQLISVGPINKKALISSVNKLSPKGMTPISLSIQTAAETLKTIENETTIILVSDGKETCNADPCATTKTLKDSGVKFVMHVVALTYQKKSEYNSSV